MISFLNLRNRDTLCGKTSIVKQGLSRISSLIPYDVMTFEVRVINPYFEILIPLRMLGFVSLFYCYFRPGITLSLIGWSPFAPKLNQMTTGNWKYCLSNAT